MSRPIIKCRKHAETEKRMEVCNKLYKEGKCKEAFRLAWTLAQEGYAPAQNRIAVRLREGSGVSQDEKRALYWFLKAAEQGNTFALYNLGLAYYYGRPGLAKNSEKAFHYMLRAAEQGDDDAQYWLGCMYQHGEGTVQNEELSFKWYLKAAEQGLACAQFAVSCCYDIQKDDKTSAEWCLRAALQGHTIALHNIGYDYRHGCGVEKNPATAFQCFSKAAEKGDAESQYIIGAEYYSGRKEFGVNQNRALGLAWVCKSAEQEFEKAQKMLAALKDEKDPDGLSYFHVALCYRHRWILKDDEDATNERSYLKLASFVGYPTATLELAQLHERHARIWFAKANDRCSLSLSYAGLVDSLRRTTNLPFELSVLCVSFLEKEAELISPQYLPSRSRKRKRPLGQESLCHSSYRRP